MIMKLSLSPRSTVRLKLLMRQQRMRSLIKSLTLMQMLRLSKKLSKMPTFPSKLMLPMHKKTLISKKLISKKLLLTF